MSGEGTPRPGKLKRELRWGETPFDDMTREELLFEVRRMFSALTSAGSALRLTRLGDELSPFWQSANGVGGRALFKVSAALEGTTETDEYRERIYRCFYRYADDLFFGSSAGHNWRVCDGCKSMWGRLDAKYPKTCRSKACPNYGQPLRRLRWDDLAPKDVTE